ncbi:DNA primase [subsurface metagenome]
MKKTIENHFAGGYEMFYEKYLGKVEKIGKGEFKALCPFHDDTNPSLNFSQDTGQYYCHGCGEKGDHLTFYAKIKNLDIKKDFKKILKGIGDDFGVSPVRVMPKIVRKYNYTDEDGNLLYQVCRTEPKGFRQRKPKGKSGWIWNIKGVRRVLYRLPEVVKANEILIAEGEKDVDNLLEIGFTSTTCAMGAGKWKPEYSKYLKGKDVVLIPHNDDEGRKHMQQVADSLTGTVKSLKVLDLPDLPDKGDVSDFIEAYEYKDQAAERLAVMIEGADKYKPRKSLPTRFTAIELMSMELPEQRWAVPDILPEGCTILAGKPKMGKSIMCLNLGISVATGGLAFGKIPVEKGGVLYLALEDTARRLKDRLAQILQGGQLPENFHFDTVWPKINGGEIPGLDKRIEEIPGLRLVIIDSLQMIRPALSGKQKTQYAIDYEDIRVIKELADKYNISILIVHHLRKTASEDVMDDISGTLGLTGAADGTLALKRITGKADAELNITGRDIEAEEYALKLHSDILSWELLGKAEEVKATQAGQLIYDTIKEHDIPITPKEINTITGIQERTIYRNLRKLVGDGSIERAIKHGAYKPK